ncbi:hypothetical protein [Halomarina oriensis]|uniref:Uncharacterized protein n=1 Tax=Halomarina oriensis TaxID=671145 RepID=A0A6B0GDM2_9EURY|nr:hypothetical protein [Halomarina oriensis]MWG33016.1 hypothetical protein [Halomarina oriensis]
MARTVLFAGTTREAGVESLVTALCRGYADRGRSVTPFAALAPAPVGATVAPAVRTQALAAGVDPDPTLSPVLRAPDGGLTVDGESVGVPDGYHDPRWGRARAAAERAHDRLPTTTDLVLASTHEPLSEGPVDAPPLGSSDLARVADADVVLVADASRGGAFASLAGTLGLLSPALRERVRACVLTRVPSADRTALEARVEQFEAEVERPVCGLLPALTAGTVDEAARTVDADLTLPFAP